MRITVIDKLCSTLATLFPGIAKLFHIGNLLSHLWAYLRQRKQARQIETEVTMLKADVIKKLHTIFDEVLKVWSTQLELTTSDRISLYIIMENQFTLCGRVSKNPEYSRSGRSSYPIDRGIIGKVWSNGRFLDNAMPKEHLDIYLSKCYRIPKKVSAKLTMQSRSCGGIRIESDSGYNAVGVIIIESENPNRFSEDIFEDVLRTDSRILYYIIDAFKDFVPALKRAGEV